MGKHKKPGSKEKNKNPRPKKKEPVKSCERCNLIDSVFPFVKDVLTNINKFYKKKYS
jgi:hypothetical protein